MDDTLERRIAHACVHKLELEGNGARSIRGLASDVTCWRVAVHVDELLDLDLPNTRADVLHLDMRDNR